jgi:hypothetical protein
MNPPVQPWLGNACPNLLLRLEAHNWTSSASSGQRERAQATPAC